MAALRVGRLANRYVLPRGGTQPVAAVHARLDRVASEYLGEALEELASAVPQVAGDEVWLVRHLHVEVAIGVEAVASPGVLARVWSQRILQAVRAALAAGEAEVVRFESEAAWTARFVAELAAGTAWDRWYLRAYSWLRPLPVGLAIAEALVREPGRVAEVLAVLWRQGEFEDVVRACGEADARRVVEAVAAGGGGVSPGGRVLARELAGLPGALRAADDPHLEGSALRLLAAACAGGVTLGAGAAGVARAVVVLADLLASGAGGPELGGAVVRRRWVEALRLGGLDPREVTGEVLAALEVLADLAGGDEGWLAGLAREVSRAGPLPATPGDGPAVVGTPFGGLLLLWPVFAECWRLPEAPGGESAVQRFVVAAHLLGRGAVTALHRDPVLALLCGLDRPPVPARLAEARSRFPVEALAAAAGEALPGAGDTAELDLEYFGKPTGAFEAAAARFCALVLRRFAAKLPGFATSSPTYLYRNFLAVPATVRLGEDTWEATVTPPPLQVVLHMAGLSAARSRLPWPPAVEVTTTLTLTARIDEPEAWPPTR